MSYSCIICLNNSHNLQYFKICTHCNNCYICNQCYKQENTHRLNQCPICRKNLSKTNNNTSFSNCISTIIFLRYFIVYIIFIIIPSNIIASGLKDNVKCSDIYITNYKLYYVITNFTNIITIPFILSFYDYYYTVVLFCFCIMNILFLTIFLSNSENPNNFYIIYNIMYLYCIIYVHLLFICLSNIYFFYKDIINKYIYEQNLLNLRIYSTHTNRSQRPRIVTHSF